jgi:hypothetical protein
MNAAPARSAAPPAQPCPHAWLQPRCACGAPAGLGGHCAACDRQLQWGLAPTLAVGAPGDAHEREAEHAADQLMHGPAVPLASGLSRLPAAATQRRETAAVHADSAQPGQLAPTGALKPGLLAPAGAPQPGLLARAGAAPAGPLARAGTPASSALAAASPAAGHPLPATTRAFMEARFGHDFGRVRIHADANAAASAHALGAQAYTVGTDIAFGSGRYAPQTDTGRHLLAHELAHVVQQGAGAADAGRLQRAPVPGGVPQPVPGGPLMPPVSPVPMSPRSTAAAANATPQSAACPSCQPTLTPDQAVDQKPLRAQLEMGRRRAVLGLSRALEVMTMPLKPPLRRLFEAQFGEGSATPTAVASVHATLQGAHDFLNTIQVWDPATGHGEIHVDAGGQTPGCATGNTAFYESGHVVVCGRNRASAQMLSPPAVEPVLMPADRPSGTSSSEPIRMVPDARATEQAQDASDAGYATKLARVLMHEAIHHMIQPGVVDIYQDERLFAQLGGKIGKHGVDLSALALQNPDSLAAFALRAPPAGDGQGLPGVTQALAVSEKLSRPVAVRPVLGKRRARLAVDLAQEAIAQTAERVAVLHSEVASVRANVTTPWSMFPPASQQMVGWLTSLGGETAFAQADAAAEQRLLALTQRFDALQKSLRSQQVSIGRRFTQDWAKRLEVRIPDWKTFRKLPPSAQLERMVVALLASAGLGQPIADVVLAHARLHGGMGALAVGPALPDLARADTTGATPAAASGKRMPPSSATPAGTADEEAMP